MEREVARWDHQKADLRQELDIAMEIVSQLVDRNRQLADEHDAVMQRLNAQEIGCRDQVVLRQLRRDHAKA